jgi:hypothetical protein
MARKNLKVTSGMLLTILVGSSVASAADMSKMEALHSRYDEMNALHSSILYIQALQNQMSQLETRDQVIEQTLSSPQTVQLTLQLNTELASNEKTIQAVQSTLLTKPSEQSEQDKLAADIAIYDGIKQSLSEEQSHEAYRQELQSTLDRIMKLKAQVDNLNSKVNTETTIDVVGGVLGGLLGFSGTAATFTLISEHGVYLPGANSGFSEGPFIALSAFVGGIVGGIYGNKAVHFVRTESAQKELTTASEELGLLKNQYAISLEAYNALYPETK